MLFNSSSFIAFLALFVFLFWCVARSRLQRLWLITVASIVFYGVWDVRFVPLLLGTALFDFFIARAISRETQDERRRRRLLALSIVLNLGVLGFFKYTNFFARSVAEALAAAGLNVHAPTLEIILPAGISFYTFQSMSYTIDIYRRELRAREHPIEFLSAVSFFPHLVAGPIIRASTLLPQFERLGRKRRPSLGVMLFAGYLVIRGYFKKIVIADNLAPFVAAMFDRPRAHYSNDLACGVLAFAGQIYCDFAGC